MDFLSSTSNQKSESVNLSIGQNHIPSLSEVLHDMFYTELEKGLIRVRHRVLHAKLLQNLIYVLALGETYPSPRSISVDVIQVTSPKYFLENLLDNQILVDINMPTSFPIRRISSTYKIRQVLVLPLTFLYMQGSFEFFMKPNSLIS